MTIRPAGLGEKDQLESLQRRASLMWDEYRAALLAHPDAIDLPAAQIAEGRVWIAEFDDVTAGFSVVLPGDGGAMDLDGLFVEPHLWGRGIGRRLVAHAAALTREAGARCLRVVANPRAAGFYIACGFDIISEEQTRFGRGLTAVLRLNGSEGRE